MLGTQLRRCPGIPPKIGNLRVSARHVTEDGIALGKWISNLRTQYRSENLNLNEDRLSQLTDLGMVWDDLEAQWQHHYSCAAEFYDKNGHLDVPINYTAADAFPLGSWLSQIRTARRKDSKRRLTEMQIAQLDQIGMHWGSRKDLLWMQDYKVAEAFYEANRQQYAYKSPGKSNAVLSKERVQLQQKIGAFENYFPDSETTWCAKCRKTT